MQTFKLSPIGATFKSPVKEHLPFNNTKARMQESKDKINDLIQTISNTSGKGVFGVPRFNQRSHSVQPTHQ